MRLEHWFYTVPLRMRSLFRREQVEHDLDEELQYHLERKIEEYSGQGLTFEEARLAALRAMEGLAQRKEECRDMRRVSGVENALRDIRYGAGMFAKSPGFTAVAVLTLALGIGANTAIFSVVNAVLLEPLPYPDPDRIVQLMLFSPGWAPGKNANTASVPEFNVFREQRQVFQEIAAYDAGKAVNFTGGELPQQLQAMHVSADYFPMFGVSIPIGRAFTADEDRPGGPHLALISEGLWRRRFAGDSGLIGKSLLLSGDSYTVIGVLGSSFAEDPAVEVLLPMQADPNSTNPGHAIRAAARLRPGVTLEMAKVQMRLAHEEFLRRFPKWAPASNAQESFTAEPLREVTVGEVRRPLLVLLGAVAFVLLIASANIANLLMARATGRRREMAIRAALGAGRQRVVSQLLTESLMLALMGGALGLLTGYAGVRGLLGMYHGEIPRAGWAAAVDWRVLGFVVLLSLGTGILFGILPAFSADTSFGSAQPNGAALQEGGVRTSAGRRLSLTGSMLVVAEIAMATVLLAGAGLLIRTFWVLQTVDPGFDAHHVLTMEMSLAGSPFQTAPAVAQLIRDAQRRIESLPGVNALAATYTLPLENQFGGPVVIEGLPNDRYSGNLCFISRRYFDVFRIPLMRGRVFSDRDDGQAPPVVLINHAMAEGRNEGMQWSSTFPWRKGDPVGERITFGKGMGPPFEDRTRQIVGVVGEVRDAGLNRNPLPMMYVPIAQLTEGMTKLTTRGLPIHWVIQTKAEPYSLTTDIERELRTVSGGMPVAHIRSMEQVVTDSTARNRFNMILLSIFAGIALVLGAIGVYGLMAYAVQQRTREISIRLALGACPHEVSRMVVREGMRLALAGVVLGVCGALALTPLLSSQLYGVEASNPSVLVSVAMILSIVALLASYIPARVAMRVDPVVALRWE